MADDNKFHLQLWAVCRDPDHRINSDPENWKPDCSCGCKFFVPLSGDAGHDWGVCIQPKSVRAGLLTFEHHGCEHFEQAIGLLP